MKCLEPGVLEQSDYHFSTPSNLAKSLFFYLLSCGEFYCTNTYNVNRKNFNSFLLMCIHDGECTVIVDNKTHIAKKGDIILLNCYKPHVYYSTSSVHCSFIHFDGNVSSEFFDVISKSRGIVFPVDNFAYFSNNIGNLLQDFRDKKPIQEARVSCIIYQMLCEILSVSVSENGVKAYTFATKTALDYIYSHSTQQINLTDISKDVNMSMFHFSRTFKSETGYSPYEYLTKCRLDHAKKQLKKSNQSVKEIAFAVGFNNESNFISTFRKKVGMSPNKFRKLPF